MKFNINNSVRVKLTEKGLKALRESHSPHSPPEEDADGWSTWQLWVLMEEIGPHIHGGFGCPIETEIEIVEVTCQRRTKHGARTGK